MAGGIISKINRGVKLLEKELTNAGFTVEVQPDKASATHYVIVNHGDLPGIVVTDRRSKGKKRARWAGEVVVTAPTETYDINTYKDPETGETFTHYVVSTHKANKLTKHWTALARDQQS